MLYVMIAPYATVPSRGVIKVYMGGLKSERYNTDLRPLPTRLSVNCSNVFISVRRQSFREIMAKSTINIRKYKYT